MSTIRRTNWQGRDQLWPIRFWPSIFGHPWFWPKPIWANPIWAKPFLANPFGQSGVSRWPRRVGTRRFGAQRERGPNPEKVGAPEGGESKISRSPATIFFLSSSLGGLLVEFWWCLKLRDPKMCTFRVQRSTGSNPHHAAVTRQLDDVQMTF